MTPDVRRRRLAASVAAVAVLMSTAGCASGTFGLSEKPNEWALACTQAAAITAPDATDASRAEAVAALEELLDTYGGDDPESTYSTLITPVVQGAREGDLQPATAYQTANC